MGIILLHLHKAEQLDLFNKPVEPKTDKPKGKVGFKADWQDIWDEEDDAKYREYFHWKDTLPKWLSKQWILRFVLNENGEAYSPYMLDNMSEKQLSGMFKRYYQDAINGQVSAVRTETMVRLGGNLNVLKPTPWMWYENDKGEKYVPTEEENRNGLPKNPEGFNELHFSNPQVTENIFIDDNPHPITFNTTINCIEPIVMELVKVNKWSLVDAINTCASTCERCLNILLEEVTGEPYNERDTANTHCDLCEQIDPAYDFKWKARECLRNPPDEKQNSEIVSIKVITADEQINEKKLTSGSVFLLPNGAIFPVWSHEGWLKDNKRDMADVFKEGWIRVSIGSATVMGIEFGEFDKSAFDRIRDLLENNPFKIVVLDCAEGVKEVALNDILKYGTWEELEKDGGMFPADAPAPDAEVKRNPNLNNIVERKELSRQPYEQQEGLGTDRKIPTFASLVKDKRWMKTAEDETFGSFYITPDDEIQQVKSHVDFERAQGKPREDLIQGGFIRISAFGAEAVADIWDADSKTLARVEKFLSKYTTFKRMGINAFNNNVFKNLSVEDIKQFGLEDAYNGKKREYEGAFSTMEEPEIKRNPSPREIVERTKLKREQYEPQEGLGTDRRFPTFAERKAGGEIEPSIAPLVEALNKVGLETDESCGGHIKAEGSSSFPFVRFTDEQSSDIFVSAIESLPLNFNWEKQGLIVKLNDPRYGSTETDYFGMKGFIDPTDESLQLAHVDIQTMAEAVGSMEKTAETMFEYDNDALNQLNDGSEGQFEKSIEYLPQDQKQWWFDYLEKGRKNYPGKKDTVAPESEEGGISSLGGKDGVSKVGSRCDLGGDTVVVESRIVSAEKIKIDVGTAYSNLLQSGMELGVEDSGVFALALQYAVGKGNFYAVEVDGFAVMVVVEIDGVLYNNFGPIDKETLLLPEYLGIDEGLDLDPSMDINLVPKEKLAVQMMPLNDEATWSANEILAGMQTPAPNKNDKLKNDVDHWNKEYERQMREYRRHMQTLNDTGYGGGEWEGNVYKLPKYEEPKDEDITLDSLYPDIVLDMEPILEEYGADASILDEFKVVKTYKYAPFYAVAVDGKITLYPVFFTLKEPLRKAKLIHELAHLIQEKTGKNWGTPEEIAKATQLEKDYTDRKITGKEFFEAYSTQVCEIKAYKIEIDYLRSQGMPDEEIKKQFMQDLSGDSEPFIDSLLKQASVFGFTKQALHPAYDGLEWIEEYTEQLPKKKNFYRWVGYRSSEDNQGIEKERWVIIRSDVAGVGKVVRVVTDSFRHQGNARAKYFNDINEAKEFLSSNFGIDTSEVNLSVMSSGLQSRDESMFIYKLSNSIMEWVNDMMKNENMGNLMLSNFQVGDFSVPTKMPERAKESVKANFKRYLPLIGRGKSVNEWLDELWSANPPKRMKKFIDFINGKVVPYIEELIITGLEDDEIARALHGKFENKMQCVDIFDIRDAEDWNNTLRFVIDRILKQKGRPGAIQKVKPATWIPGICGDLMDGIEGEASQVVNRYLARKGEGFNRKEWQKEYYQKNKERIDKYRTEWARRDRLKNKERFDKYRSEFETKNPDARKRYENRQVNSLEWWQDMVGLGDEGLEELLETMKMNEYEKNMLLNNDNVEDDSEQERCGMAERFLMRRKAKEGDEYHHEEKEDKGYSWAGACPHCGGAVNTSKTTDTCPNCKKEYNLSDKAGV